jgi:hypothetical protein
MEAGVREVMEGRLPPTTLSDGAPVEVEGGRIWAASTPAAAAVPTAVA